MGPRFMKKIARIIFSCGIIVAVPLILFIASVYPSFHVSASRRDTRTCTRYYEGMSKGVIWEHGEWHHYVDFQVDNSAGDRSWRVTNAPVDSSIWKNFYPLTSPLRRVAYRWPSNWWDPFPASSWKICLLSS
jgi:hypothetical protein